MGPVPMPMFPWSASPICPGMSPAICLPIFPRPPFPPYVPKPHECINNFPINNLPSIIFQCISTIYVPPYFPKPLSSFMSKIVHIYIYILVPISNDFQRVEHSHSMDGSTAAQPSDPLRLPTPWQGSSPPVWGSGGWYGGDGQKQALCSYVVIDSVPCGNLTVCYWKWPFIVSFPQKNMVIFHSYVSLPDGKYTYIYIYCSSSATQVHAYKSNTCISYMPHDMRTIVPMFMRILNHLSGLASIWF